LCRSTARKIDVAIVNGIFNLNPASNSLLPVEETSFCEKECTGTDGCDTTGLPCDFRDPGDEVGIVTTAFCAGTSGDYKGVDGAVDSRRWELRRRSGRRDWSEEFVQGRGLQVQSRNQAHWKRPLMGPLRRGPEREAVHDDYSAHEGSLDELNWFQARRVKNTALTLCASKAQGQRGERAQRKMCLLAQAKPVRQGFLTQIRAR
jgi:hypothetical protein